MNRAPPRFTLPSPRLPSPAPFRSWLASQTTRPELPWSFGVIDSPEVNAFAVPGGYVLVTRGLYELLADDAEVAAVLGHEIGHVVQRDHYRSEEHTSELQSLMRTSYAVFCLKKKKNHNIQHKQ